MITAGKRSPVAFVHAGTHKTGTTSIQALLATNDAALRSAGVHVPVAGRVDVHFGAHHNIAWELNGDRHFDAAHGTLADLFAEVARERAPVVCLSSEDFELDGNRREPLGPLCSGLRSLGYDVRIVVFLRPQADYLESLYAELLASGWNLDFGKFLRDILTAGRFGTSPFDYEPLLDRFAAAAGPENVVVRAYGCDAPNDRLLREFMAIVAADRPLHFERLVLPGRLNPMATFRDVIAARSVLTPSFDALHAFEACDTERNQRFDPLALYDIVRVAARFARSNERIARRYGAHVGCVSWQKFLREAIAMLVGDDRSDRRKRAFLAAERPATPETVPVTARVSLTTQ